MQVSKIDGKAVEEILAAKGPLAAVRELRARTGCSLSDAVEYVDRAASQGDASVPPAKPAEWWVYLILLVVVLAVVVFVAVAAWYLWITISKLLSA